MINSYSYADGALSGSDVYYRLKSVDIDGKINYSKVVSIHQRIEQSIKIIPNPAAKNCTVYFDAVAGNNNILKIFSENGKQQKQIILTAKQTSVTINVSSISAGIYFCKLEAGVKYLHKN